MIHSFFHIVLFTCAFWALGAYGGKGVWVSPQPDFVETPVGKKVHIPVLQNDIVNKEGYGGVCVMVGKKEVSKPAGRAIKFKDVTEDAGIVGPPQKRVRTSPNCAFDQYDVVKRQWSKGTLCMPEYFTGGAATADVDNDGYPDIYVTRLDNIDSLYRNLGNGTFQDITVQSDLAMTREIKSNGVALLDIDNDGDIDIYISTVGDTRFYLFVNDGTGHYTEEAVVRGVDLTRPAVAAGLGGKTSSFSIAFSDFDNDGYLDIYTTEWFPRMDLNPEFLKPGMADAITTCKLFRNMGKANPGHFTDASSAFGVRVKPTGSESITSNPAYLLNEYWWLATTQAGLENHLRKQNLTIEEVQARLHKLNEEAFAMQNKLKERNAALEKLHEFAIKTNHEQGHVPVHFMNFAHLGVFEFGARFADFDGDGYVDLLISGDFGTTQLYWNEGGKYYSAGYLHPLWDAVDNSMGQAVGDLNGDGLLDVLFTSMSLKAPSRTQLDKFFPDAGITARFEGNHLYFNEGKRLFADVTDESGVRDTGWTWGGALFDYDNDGWLDIIVANGLDDPETTDDDFAVNLPNVVFRNLGPSGGFHFTSVAAELGLDDRRDGRGVFEFDYDLDGDLDIFVVNNAEKPALYRNDGGNQHSWIRVRVVEPACENIPGDANTAYCTPRDSIGARVYVRPTAHANEILREVGSSTAYMAQSEATVHVGLGSKLTNVYSLRVVWPARNTSRVLYNVPVCITMYVQSPPKVNTSLESIVRTPGGSQNAGTMDLHPCETRHLRIKQVAGNFHGKIEVDPTLQFVTYTPSEGFIGTEVFNYTVAAGDYSSKQSEAVRVVVSPRVQQQSADVAPSQSPYLPDESGVVSRFANPPHWYAEELVPPATLPSARAISNVLFRQRAPLFNKLGVNELFVSFCGFVMHDMQWTWNTDYFGQLDVHPGWDILIPKGDAQWDPVGAGSIKMPYARAAVSRHAATFGTTRTAFWRQVKNGASPFLDVEAIYGHMTSVQNVRVRFETGSGSMLSAFLPMVVPRNVSKSSAFKHGELPRCSDDESGNDSGCNLNFAGLGASAVVSVANPRINLHPGLVLIGTVFQRYHNILVQNITNSQHLIRELVAMYGATNTQIDAGQAVFEQVRHLVSASYQTILWYEWLPLLVGEDQYAALPKYHGWLPEADPSVTVEFVTAIEHAWLSMLPNKVACGQNLSGCLDLKDGWFSPFRGMPNLSTNYRLRAMTELPAESADLLMVDGVRDGFLGERQIGLDLSALWLQKSRDLGCATYTEVRTAFGLKVPDSIAELVEMSDLPSPLQKRLHAHLTNLYTSIDEVEFAVGGLLEAPCEGGMIGPTFAAVITEQLVRARNADADWFENSGGMRNSLLRHMGYGSHFRHALGSLLDSVTPADRQATKPAGTGLEVARSRFRIQT